MNTETIQGLVERVRALTRLNDDEHSALLKLLRNNKCYGSMWEDTPMDVEECLPDELLIFIEDEKKSITDCDEDASNHIHIEVDKLKNTTTLALIVAGKYSAIYIDSSLNINNQCARLVPFCFFSIEKTPMSYIKILLLSEIGT